MKKQELVYSVSLSTICEVYEYVPPHSISCRKDGPTGQTSFFFLVEISGNLEEVLLAAEDNKMELEEQNEGQDKSCPLTLCFIQPPQAQACVAYKSKSAMTLGADLR